MSYTIPSDSHTIGDAGHTTDHNSIIDVLTGMGAATNVLNTAYAGGADPTGANDSTAAIAAAVSAISTAGGGTLCIPAGNYVVSSTLNWKIPGLQVVTDGSASTKITMTTSNTPILQVAGEGQSIGGLTLTYTTQQGSSDTASHGIEFGDATIGSAWMSRYYDLFILLSYQGLAIPSSLSTTSIAGMFSCHFDTIRIFGYYHHGIGLAANGGGNNAGCTGCVFDNIYIHNNYSGSPANCDSYPVYLSVWDECEFNQLNIEHGESFDLDLLSVSQVGTLTINGLHIESMQLSGTNAAYINADNNSAVVVNGMTVKYGTMSGTTDNAVARFSTAGPSSVIIRGFKEETTNTFTTPSHPWADFGSITNCTMQVDGITRSQVTSQMINPAAGSTVQVSPAGKIGMLGDGSDGAVTFDGTTTILGMAPSSSTYTMTRDIFCTNITINSGVTLKPSGFRIFCQGPVTGSGTISANGNAASGSTAGGTSGSGVLSGGRPGGAGGTTGAGSNGTGSSLGLPAAGAGGAGAGGAAGTGGTAASTGTYFFRTPYTALSAIVPSNYNSNSSALTGGAGGGGAGGSPGGNGGGGGGGGGPIVIFAWSVAATLTLTATGGAGGNGASNGGGGGGGTGGLVLLYTLTAWSGTATVTAGGAGTGAGTGSNGSAGGSGFSLNVVLN